MERTILVGGGETEADTEVLEGEAPPVPASLRNELVGTVSAEGATDEEADAIAAAIHAHIAGSIRASEAEQAAAQWVTAARLRRVGARATPPESDRDPWAAAGRAPCDW
jgi:hypothetical protein